MARRHVREAEERIARLRSRISDMQARGFDTALSERALETFHQLLELARDHLKREEQTARFVQPPPRRK